MNPQGIALGWYIQAFQSKDFSTDTTREKIERGMQCHQILLLKQEI